MFPNLLRLAGDRGNSKSDDEQYLLFMKSPTAAKPAGNSLFSTRKSTFTSSCLDSTSNWDSRTVRSVPRKKFDGGVYLQFETLDCFLSPHDCDLGETWSIRAFLNACETVNVPCGITLDPYQFWYETNLWNCLILKQKVTI